MEQLGRSLDEQRLRVCCNFGFSNLITGALGAAILAYEQASKLLHEGKLELKRKGLDEAYIDFSKDESWLSVLKDLEYSKEYKILNAAGFAMETQVQDNDRINMVFNYVKDHFQEEISLEAVAEMASMTVPSFCRYFKKITKKTFTKFVNEYRIVHASKLLAEKPIGITEICYESGFNNFSHFNKLFKEFTGKSASQYRKELKSII